MRLQNENGGCGIHTLLLLALTSFQAERTYSALGGDGRHALVCETHASARTLSELFTEHAHFAGPVALIAGEREWQTDYNVAGPVLLYQVRDGLHGRTLACASPEYRQWLGDGGGGVADGDADAAFAVIDAEDPLHSAEPRQRGVGLIARGDSLIHCEHRVRAPEQEATTMIAA